MRVAFHTPLNPFGDGRISGDRRMAHQIANALERLGHEVEPIPDARSYMRGAEPDLLQRMQDKAAAKLDALLQAWRETGAVPELWFTYHSYYKAPDLLGPAIAAALDIPYVVAEASDSERREQGEWAAHVALSRGTFCAADLHLCFTARDRLGIENLCGETTRFLDFPPFIDVANPVFHERKGDMPPRLITVAMMRDGVKHESYLALARVLAGLADPWTLTVIGDGPMRAQVERAFTVLPAERIDWRGALAHNEVTAQLAEHDIFIWPGIGEAYGLVYLEAQAAGLPVVAFDGGGVPCTVRDGETALLAPDRDETALAAALDRLLEDPALRRRMGRAAAHFIASERTLDAACAILAKGLTLAMDVRGARRNARR